ncbi:MAG TPA: hydroxymethylpyrimidine/phosphomethylpyrimidine kinase [Micromonosporaceae bacterium]|jgi:hydroxymethylpyrimidine kinase/phosphomethylpyrimidine kinase
MTINGADPTGQTGIAADLAVFRTHRLTTQCVVTAAAGPGELYALPTTVVGGQLSVALRQATPAAVKVGLVATAEIAGSIAAHVRAGDLRNVVVDPELEAGYGSHLGVVASLMRLLPLAAIVTPNIDEAAALVGFPVTNPSEMAKAAAQLASLGARYVVVTGGRLGGDECVDAVWTPTGKQFLRAPRIDAPNTRGAGCMFSAMIAARLAQGRGVAEAITIAKEQVTKALTAARAHAYANGQSPILPSPTDGAASIAARSGADKAAASNNGGSPGGPAGDGASGNATGAAAPAQRSAPNETDDAEPAVVHAAIRDEHRHAESAA